MIQYFLDKPYLIFILIALILVTLFVCVKAGNASAKRSKANEKIMKKLKEENELRNEFAVLTPSLAEKSLPERLFKGVALNLQKRVSDATNMNSEFESLTQEQKEIYALSFVIEDGGEKLSEFFKINGQPLTCNALSAVKHILSPEAVKVFENEYDAFDPDNETSSLISSAIDADDEKFSALADQNVICTAAGNFIKENIEKFI